MKNRVFGLDAMRASAIVLVLAAHLVEGAAFFLGLNPLPIKPFLNACGYLGVEVFFVLSGFLIGRIVLGIVERGSTFDQWRVFLLRRWGRTVPLYFFWVTTLLVLSPPERQVGSAAAHYLTFTQNLAWPMPAGNWFPVSWSLPVEEWFYILFALVVFGLSAISRRHAVLAACLLFLVLPPVGRFFATGDWDAAIRKVVVLRLDAIAYGVAVAILWNARGARSLLIRLSAPLACVGAVCLSYLLWHLAELVKHPVSGNWVLSAGSLGVALWIPALANWRMARSWATAPVTWLAERSYGLYLSHLSIMFATVKVIRWGWITRPTLTVLFMFAALCLVTEVLYRTVELPVLRRRPTQHRPDGKGFAASNRNVEEPPEAREPHLLGSR